MAARGHNRVKQRASVLLMVKGKGEKEGERTGWEDEVAGQGDGEPQEREGHLSLRALGGGVHCAITLFLRGQQAFCP